MVEESTGRLLQPKIGGGAPQRAKESENFEPARSKAPPTYKAESDRLGARAFTAGTAERYCISAPLPRASQYDPLKVAILLTGTPPALVNFPPINSSPSILIREFTELPEVIPPPTSDHEYPSHMAIFRAGISWYGLDDS